MAWHGFSDYGQMMDERAVEGVRAFTRTVTHRIGALDDAFLSRGRPLGHSRVLWEIDTKGVDVRALRARLDLDSGYLSRILRTLEDDELVVLDSHPADRRVRVARLTALGEQERAELDRRSDQAASAVLGPLRPAQRARLISAMAEVERLLVASMVESAPQDPRHPHARRCLVSYFTELASRFDTGFDPALSLPAADNDLTPPSGLLLVATLHGEPVGCAAIKFHGEQPAEVKRMWVADSVRGLGLGRRLLVALEVHARNHGVHTLHLETNQALTEAINLYRSAGYREVTAFNDEPFAHHWFEKRLDAVPPDNTD